MPWFCGGCDLRRGEEHDSPPEGVCPKCGVDIGVWYPSGKEFHLRVGRRESRSRPPGGGRWVYQAVSYASHFKATGRKHFVERVIDRISGEYHERIIDKETGEVVREVHEPLADHRGRGSAKQ